MLPRNCNTAQPPGVLGVSFDFFSPLAAFFSDLNMGEFMAGALYKSRRNANLVIVGSNKIV